MKEDLRNLFLKASNKALDAAGEIVKEVTEEAVRMASRKIGEITDKTKETITDKQEINRILKKIKNRRF